MRRPEQEKDFTPASNQKARPVNAGEKPIARRPASREVLRSVRGYGLRTNEPRQGRNAATVV